MRKRTFMVTVGVLVIALIASGVFLAIRKNGSEPATLESFQEADTTNTDTTDTGTANTTEATESESSEATAEEEEEDDLGFQIGDFAGTVNEIIGVDDEGLPITRGGVIEFEEYYSGFSLRSTQTNDVFKLLGIEDKYLMDPNGYYLVPIDEEPFALNDWGRTHSVVVKGLNGKGEPISDAPGFAFEDLTDKDVKTILAAKSGQTFELEYPRKLELNYYEVVLSNPGQLRADINLTIDQKYGDSHTVGELSPDLQKFLDECEQADKDGLGMDHWVRWCKVNGEWGYYMTPDYIDYATLWLSVIYADDVQFEVIKTVRNYHLVHRGVANNYRWLTESDYQYTMSFMVWPARLKNGQVCLKFMVNLRDKRPALGNLANPGKTYTPPKKTPSKPAPVIVPETTPAPVTVPVPTTVPDGTPSNTPDNKPGKTPDDTPGKKPDDTPGDDTPPGGDGDGYKVPDEGSGPQGNAPVGAGTGDNPGPGPDHGDQGNSASPNVQDSQFTPNEEKHDDTSNDTPGATQANQQANEEAKQNGGANIDNPNPNGGGSHPEDAPANVSNDVQVDHSIQDSHDSGDNGSGGAGTDKDNDDGGAFEL